MEQTTADQMTTETSEAATGEAAGQLAGEFAARGLALAPVDEAPALAGPLSAVGFGIPDDNGPTAIAAAVAAGDDLELFDLAVAAIQATHLDLAPATAVSIGSPAELIDTLPQPLQLFAILQADTPIGLVARHADRRRSPAGVAGGDESSPNASNSPQPGGVAPGGVTAGGSADLGLLQDVVLEVTVELGRTALPLVQLMNLGIGSVVELDRNAGAPVDVRVNGTLFAKGEVVVVDNEYAVRIIEILPPTPH